MQMILRYVLLLASCLASISAFATHNIGGEILFQKTGPLTVKAWIVTYTNASSLPADRDSLELCWGDGFCEKLLRVNGPNGNGELVAPNIKRNIYIGTHTYTQADRYWLTMTDPNRSAGILNVNFPNSENVPFYLRSMVNLLPEAAGSQESPILLELPIDQGLVDRPFYHTPNAFDKEGDSLVYALVSPLMEFNTPVPNYQQPTAIAPGNNNVLTLDAETGLLAWKNPQQAGAYVIAIEVRSYRAGVLTEVVTRDMLIEIDTTDGFNSPPDIEMSVSNTGIHDVHVGDTVRVGLVVSDPNANQLISLSSSSGLYSTYQDTATFTLTGAKSGMFEWVVGNEHLRAAPYQIVFKAKDDGNGYAGPPLSDNSGGHGLAVFEIIRFRVQQTTSTSVAVEKGKSLLAYPNPVLSRTTIDLQEPTPTDLRYYIYDELGRIQLSGTVPAGDSKIQLDLSGLSSAVYHFRLTDGHQLLGTARLLKSGL